MLELGLNGVSGKPHRRMAERAVLLKTFRLRFEVSEKLMIHAPELQKARLRHARVWVLGSAGGAAVRAAKNPAQQRRGLGSGIRRANYQPDSEN